MSDRIPQFSDNADEQTALAKKYNREKAAIADAFIKNTTLSQNIDCVDDLTSGPFIFAKNIQSIDPVSETKNKGYISPILKCVIEADIKQGRGKKRLKTGMTVTLSESGEYTMQQHGEKPETTYSPAEASNIFAAWLAKLQETHKHDMSQDILKKMAERSHSTKNPKPENRKATL